MVDQVAEQLASTPVQSARDWQRKLPAPVRRAVDHRRELEWFVVIEPRAHSRVVLFVQGELNCLRRIHIQQFLGIA